MVNDAAQQRIELHVVTKNLQSIRSESRFEDFCMELGHCEYDVCLFNETWRSNEDTYTLPRGDCIFLSGGDGNGGVGIAVSGNLMAAITRVSFHAYSDRVCLLKFSNAGFYFHFLSCYFPTSWADDTAVEGVYSTLEIVLNELRSYPGPIVLGGDFNVSVGGLQPGDDVTLVGRWGCGLRNARGRTLVNWVLENGFQILSRHSDMEDVAESWTCRRYFDDAKVQLDFLIGDMRAQTKAVWMDNSLPIGLDHRCVHCLLAWEMAKHEKQSARAGLKHWQPHLGDAGHPTLFQAELRKLLGNEQTDSIEQGITSLEEALYQAGRIGGKCNQTKCKFKGSDMLTHLRQQRRLAISRDVRRTLSFEIVKLQRREVRAWKSSKVQTLLQHGGTWKRLRQLQNVAMQRTTQLPPPDAFADMLEEIFHGYPGAPTQPEQLDEPLWTCRELTFAIKRLKNNKATDECGLVAEVLRCVPHDCLNSLLQIMNEILQKGVVPSSWRKTLFQMLPKNHRAHVPADFRPIANLRLLYKVFAYLVLGRVEATLEQHQPEEQHGFKSGRRIEEHLLTANTVIDKTLLANVPLWIVSLDLSKAFDRVSWDSLWEGLLRHGVSQHLVWALRLIYWEQKGQIITKQHTSREFDIKAGVRQGCVLSPRLFSCVLEVALKKWREQLQDGGLDLGDGGIPLLDLRFADDILLFATSSVEAARMVDALVTCLKEVGLALNASKTKILTTQAQPGKTVTIQNGLEMEILDATRAHKWLGCLLSTLNAGNREADLDFRLQAASKAFYANKWILCDENVSLKSRIKFFDSVVTSVVRFGAGQRKLYKSELRKLDVHCRKLLRQVVGPPGNIDWTQPWHSILHQWNQRVVEQMQLNGSEFWSNRCMLEYWKFVQYAALLDDNRWLTRALVWNPGGGRRGRSFDLWDAPVTKFCRWQNFGEWQVAAQDKALWLQYLPDFVTFMHM